MKGDLTGSCPHKSELLQRLRVSGRLPSEEPDDPSFALFLPTTEAPVCGPEPRPDLGLPHVKPSTRERLRLPRSRDGSAGLRDRSPRKQCQSRGHPDPEGAVTGGESSGRGGPAWPSEGESVLLLGLPRRSEVAGRLPLSLSLSSQRPYVPRSRSGLPLPSSLTRSRTCISSHPHLFL